MGPSGLDVRVVITLPSLRAFRACTSTCQMRCPPRRLCHAGVCLAESGAGDQLSAEFSRVVNEAGAADLLRHRQPTHLLPPTAVVAAVLNALQRNDWPEPDAGVRTAFAFTKPYQGEDPTQPTPPRHARSWGGKEEWLDDAAFGLQLHAPPYAPLLECDAWRLKGPLCFPSTRTEAKAVQAVEIDIKSRLYVLSFCLERAEQGSLKGAWLVVGVRQGDYSV